LIDADRVQITEHVRAVYEALSPGSGYVLSVSAPVTDAVPPECFVALVQAAQRGRG
jgi:uroporphyrinogen-III decarboxylase